MMKAERCRQYIKAILALTLAAWGSSMAVTQAAGGGSGGGAVTINAAYVAGTITLIPADAAWKSATAASVTLRRFIDYVEGSGNTGGMDNQQCLMMGTAISRPVTVKAVHNGSTIFFRYEWSDATQDTVVNDTDKFGDALAMEIPYAGNVDTALAMGTQTVPVNILFWRADLAKPQNIVGGGIGTPQVSHDAQNIQHYQGWASGKWTVIVSRPMTGASDNQVTLTRGSSYRVAFANWNGSDLNRNGRKAFSNWDTLTIK